MNPVRDERFFSSGKRQDRLSGPPTLLFNGTGVLSRQQNGRGVQVNHSPPYSAEVKNEWNSTSAPPACLLGQAKLYNLPSNLYYYQYNKRLLNTYITV